MLSRSLGAREFESSGAQELGSSGVWELGNSVTLEFGSLEVREHWSSGAVKWSYGACHQ